MKNKKIIIYQITNKILQLILFMLIAYNLIYTFQNAFLKTEVIDIFSLKTYIMKDESMKPNINKFEFIIAKKYKKNNPKIGDIVIYKEENNQIRIKRIVGEENHEYITKADNNYYNDINNLKVNNIIGRVVISIPILGFILNIVKSKIFMIIIIILLLAIYFRAKQLRKRKFKRRMKKIDKEDS